MDRDGRRPGSGSRNPENFKMKPEARPGTGQKISKPGPENSQTENPARNPWNIVNYVIEASIYDIKIMAWRSDTLFKIP